MSKNKDKNMGKKLTTEQVKQKCLEVRGDYYNYDKIDYVNSETNIIIICPKHGEFSVRYHDFLKGVNCPICAKKIASEKISVARKKNPPKSNITTEEFINKIKTYHPDLNIQFDKTEYVNNHTTVILTVDGKDYNCYPKVLWNGGLPRELSFKNRGIKKAQNRWKNIDEELKNIHDNKYEYLQEEIDLIKSGKIDRNFVMHIKCKKHGIFEQTFFDHRCGHGCKKCALENRPIINVSKPEQEILNFIKTFYNGEVITNDRKVLEGKELDLYFPKENLAIEYDGLFWHNNIDNSYKFEECRKKGIRLIRITEPEWEKEKYKIKYFLQSTFGVFEKRIFARKCEIKEINNEVYKSFCNENHLQGCSFASVKIGLFFEGQLIQIISFGKPRFNKKIDWELIRECSKLGYSIIGGKEKLEKYFERKYNPKNILSYCEKDKFSGKSYYRNGFKLINESKPGYTYYYGKDYIPLSRIAFQKYKLKNKLKKFDEKLTEWENMLNNGYKRLFDYGNYIFLKELLKGEK